eukprot:Hpha_TRINITY_DN28047_c0_g1::TRINITY_DN28047_c0_g1_i1::g.42528::m.42528
MQLGWFGDMLRDDLRNKKYDEAVRRVVSPLAEDNESVRCVDAGCGTGLLSLFALRAGAGVVVGVERDPYLAMLATMCAHRLDNQMQFPTPGAELRIALDDVLDVCFGEEDRGDVCVAELMDASGVGEDIASIVLHAHRCLLKPHAKVIPRRLRLLGGLARMALPPVDGIRVAALEQFWLGGQAIELGQGGDGGDWELLTTESLFVDLMLEDPDALGKAIGATHNVVLRGEREGEANAIVSWFEAELCEGVWLANTPGAAVTHWGQAVQPLEAPISVSAGGETRVSVRIDGAKMRVTPAVGGKAAPPAASLELQSAAQERLHDGLHPLLSEASRDLRTLCAIQAATVAIAAQPHLFGGEACAAATLVREALLRRPRRRV